MRSGFTLALCLVADAGLTALAKSAIVKDPRTMAVFTDLRSVALVATALTFFTWAFNSYQDLVSNSPERIQREAERQARIEAEQTLARQYAAAEEERRLQRNARQRARYAERRARQAAETAAERARVLARLPAGKSKKEPPAPTVSEKAEPKSRWERLLEDDEE